MNSNNSNRVIFWICFVVVLVLIIWGLIVAMNKPASDSKLGAPADVTAADHVRGPSDARVTLIEYGDFQCPACEAYFPVVEQLYNESSSTMKMVFRHFPLPQHPNAVPAAIASEAAAVQGKFWEMFSLLYGNHADWTEMPDPTSVFVGYATKIGLNIEQFKMDLASSTLKAKITASSDEGVKIGINQTPTFFVNGKVIQNPQSYAAFKSIIASSTEQ
jgi:protein-disulfide isomerase